MPAGPIAGKSGFVGESRSKRHSTRYKAEPEGRPGIRPQDDPNWRCECGARWGEPHTPHVRVYRERP